MFTRVDPARIAHVASRAHEATPETVRHAVEVARRARRVWRRVPYRERLARMAAVGGAISECHLELAAAMSLETGKSRIEAIVEVQEAIELIETYSEEMERHDGFVAPLRSFTPAEHGTETLRPYGTFGVIAPFNFPLALTMGMTAAALIAGNTVVVKPSEETPWTGALLAEAMLAGGLPRGVFNLIHGGPATGRALVESPVDGIAFTGSAAVGRQIAHRLTEGPYARPALTEMGGKNPAIVTSSADLDARPRRASRAPPSASPVRSAAPARGPSCSTASTTSCSSGCTRSPRRSPSGIPPSQTRSWAPSLTSRPISASARASRRPPATGRIVRGGGLPSTEGWFVEPTVVADLPLGHPLTRRELFLPLLTVTRVDTLEQAIVEANATDYGLAAGIFSEDEHEIELFLDELQAGVLYVNRRAGATTGAWPRTQSFCGWKSSGTTGKGGLGPYYLPQFMREQSRTVVG